MKFLRLTEVRNRIPLSKASIYRLIASGTFPKPIKTFGGRASFWLESSIEAWIAAQVTGHRKWQE